MLSEPIEHPSSVQAGGWVPLPSRRARRVLLVLALVIVALEPFLFLGSFAGDAEVHLVFAESASHGRFFEFNPGERVSGETSPGYMLLGAAFFRLLPARWVPVAMKAVGLVTWYLFCWLVYRIASRVLVEGEHADPFWPAAAAIAAAMIPGSVYNANVGMENGLFAAVIWTWLYLADRWKWFERTGAVYVSQEVALGALVGLSFWLRPEAALVAVVAFAFRLFVVRRPPQSWMFGAATALAFAGGCLAFQYAFTGDIVATSIISRRILVIRSLVSFGPLVIDPTLAERLIFYAPLTFFFLLGVHPARGAYDRNLTRYLKWLLATTSAFYTLFGSPQLARYIVPFAPVFPILGTRGARRWLRGTPSRRITVGVVVVSVLAIDLAEPLYRRMHYSQHLLAKAMAAPTSRRQRTDELLQSVGGVRKYPLVLACEAIQDRYELDDRVIVRSLDGRTDRALLSFVHDRRVDQVAYLKRIQADVVTKPPNFGLGSTPSDLPEIEAVRPGDETIRGSLSFRRLPKFYGFAVSELRPALQLPYGGRPMPNP